MRRRSQFLIPRWRWTTQTTMNTLPKTHFCVWLTIFGCVACAIHSGCQKRISSVTNDTRTNEVVEPRDQYAVDCKLTLQRGTSWIGHLVFTNVGSAEVCLPEYKLLLTSDPGFKAFTLHVDGAEVLYGGKMIKRRSDGKKRCLVVGESIEVDFDLTTVYPQLAASTANEVSVKYNSHSIDDGNLILIDSNVVLRSR